MSDHSYQKQLGLIDENGNLTHQAKVNRVYGVVRKFGIPENQVYGMLSACSWDMEAAIEQFMMSNQGVYKYVNSHRDLVNQMLYHDSSMDESVAKFAVEHPQVMNAAESAPKVIEGLFGVVGLFFIIVILVVLGL